MMVLFTRQIYSENGLEKRGVLNIFGEIVSNRRLILQNLKKNRSQSQLSQIQTTKIPTKSILSNGLTKSILSNGLVLQTTYFIEQKHKNSTLSNLISMKG